LKKPAGYHFNTDKFPLLCNYSFGKNLEKTNKNKNNVTAWSCLLHRKGGLSSLAPPTLLAESSEAEVQQKMGGGGHGLCFSQECVPRNQNKEEGSK